ncbi:MAG: DUF1080 domain-containing protein [Acidobacteria bacterium]|nr:DUF1080 domain-containing protein [Acidobacteriota bacterium]
MRRILAVLTIVMVGSAVPVGQGVPNTLTPKEVAEGWLLLWDGETLFGWEPHGEAQWKISGGVLVADSEEGGWLGTTTPFADFELQAEFRTAADGNSGLFIRSARDGAPHETGYEVQIFDDQPAGYNTGSLVNCARASEAKIIPSQWNSMEVTAQGDHFVVEYNGKQVLDARDGKHAVGVIGLQYNRGKKVKFRNIKLRPLGLKPIFNGMDLSGWERVEPPTKPKLPAEWSVKDGAIHVERGPGQLETQGTWGDFVLQLDVRCNAQGPAHHPNSGVFFRGDNGKFWSGYESQIYNDYKDGNRAMPIDVGTGGIYFRQAARRVVSNDNEYFTKTLVAQGRHLSVWVNGIQVSDYTDPREEGMDARKQARLAAGAISLQAHDPTTNLDFRNLRIAPLPMR